MSIGQAAKYLGVSRDTLRRWEKRGKIKTVRSPSNRRYYTKNLLDGLMSDKTKQAIIKPGKRTIGGNKKGLIGLGALGFIIAVILALIIQFFLL